MKRVLFNVIARARSARSNLMRLPRPPFGPPRNDGFRGFTLIEVLVAVTIFTIVSTASYGVFSMGLQIWRRSKDNQAVERKILFALEKMNRDVAGTLRTHTESLKGSGGQTRFALPSIVKAPSEGDEMLQYGHVIYQWNPSRKELCRGERTASDHYRDKNPVCRPVAGWIKNLRFRYLVYEDIGETYDWTGEWDEEDELPIAIQVQLDIDPKAYGQTKGSKQARYERTLLLPVGGKIAKEKFSLGKMTTVTVGAPAAEGVTSGPAA